MIATGNMVPLRPCSLTLTLLDTRKLFNLTMETFDIPSDNHVPTCLRDCQIRIAIVRNNPINVTVFGNHLEKGNAERKLLESY